MPRLEPPATGFTVRMYRQGHGDCFLLATRKEEATPFYLLIDCGLWTGSEVDPRVTMEAVVDDIAVSTANHVDVVLITHEHMDHVSGFNVPSTARPGTFCWDAIDIGEVWLAWTEDGADPDANALRRRFDDVLLGLVGVADRPGAFGLTPESHRAQLIRDVLALHTGETSFGDLAAAARDSTLAAVAGLSNKHAIKRMRDKARRPTRFLNPGQTPFPLPGVGEGLRVFTLGPPRDPGLLLSLDPKGPEEFRFRLDGAASTLLGALSLRADGTRLGNPFSPRFGVPPERLASPSAAFFEQHYGTGPTKGHRCGWRRIDDDWTEAAESLALRLNDEVNNTSLVVALELPRTGKVLLFTGDAQRGSWISWSDLTWDVAGGRLTARDLLARTVLYKVGHHGSHNATLSGRAGDAFANLEWFGRGRFADEFVAFIPANKPWAEAKKPRAWKHPLEAIEVALSKKAEGRVLRMDRGTLPERPEDVSLQSWRRFVQSAKVTPLYVEYVITDD